MIAMSRCFETVLSSSLVVATALICTAAREQDAPTASPARASVDAQKSSSPRNLKVLPKYLTDQQLHDTMEQWAVSLSVQCGACHAYDGDKINPDGTPKLNFADDSNQMKVIARLMVTMTDQINDGYIDKLEGSGLPVTCGTCHRGRISPEPFIGSVGNHALKSAVSPINDSSHAR